MCEFVTRGATSNMPSTSKPLEYLAGIEAANKALTFMAADNGMSRTNNAPDIDSTLAAQALRVLKAGDMEKFVQHDCCTVTRLEMIHSARDFSEWLTRCFDGDLSKLYFNNGHFNSVVAERNEDKTQAQS